MQLLKYIQQYKNVYTFTMMASFHKTMAKTRLKQEIEPYYDQKTKQQQQPHRTEPNQIKNSNSKNNNL